MPLFHQCVYTARPFMILAHRVDSWVRLMIISSLVARMHLPALLKQANRDEASRSLLDWFLRVLWSKHLLFLAIGSYYQVLEEPRTSVIVCKILGGWSMEPHWPKTSKEVAHLWDWIFFFKFTSLWCLVGLFLLYYKVTLFKLFIYVFVYILESFFSSRFPHVFLKGSWVLVSLFATPSTIPSHPSSHLTLALPFYSFLLYATAFYLSSLERLTHQCPLINLVTSVGVKWNTNI